MIPPRRGEVWWVDLGFAAKTRPCLVMSIPIEDSDRVLATIVPHTTSSRGTRFEVNVAAKFLKPGTFDAQNLLTLPHAKFVSKLGSVSAVQLTQVEDAVKMWLGLAT